MVESPDTIVVRSIIKQWPCEENVYDGGVCVLCHEAVSDLANELSDYPNICVDYLIVHDVL